MSYPQKCPFEKQLWCKNHLTPLEKKKKISEKKKEKRTRQKRNAKQTLRSRYVVMKLSVHLHLFGRTTTVRFLLFVDA